jgi:hypothetical protein
LSTIAALAFAISVGTLIASLGIAYSNRDHVATLVTASVTAIASGWTIVASTVFSQSTAQNLALAGSLAIGALALIGLITNELAGERVRRSPEISDDRRETRLAAAA